MTVRKQKRKIIHKSKNKSLKRSVNHSSLVSKHPRTYFYLGILLLAIGVYLLIIGAHNNAKIGLSMLAIFIGGAAVILANAALPKKAG